jgi:photosystem I subunit 11
MILKKDLKLSFKNFDVISTYQNDPFVGHLTTPFTKSNFVLSYLMSLPIYSVRLSFFLKGLYIGLIHSYFLFGPFLTLGPLRNTSNSNLIAFLATLGLIIFLSSGISLYIFVFSPEYNLKKLFLTKKDWKQFLSGFFIGGFGGIIVAYLLNIININNI